MFSAPAAYISIYQLSWRMYMKKIVYLLFTLLTFIYIFSFSSLDRQVVQAEEKAVSGGAVDVSATAAVLLEGSSGEIIFEKDKDKELVPASITKIMTLNLIFEAIDSKKLSLEDSVTVSEYAASMGGSQVYLEPNETQTVNDMIKCITIASANDAAVAMAEKIAGSEEAFVKKMNEKAKALGMKHTQFKNCTGLDDNIESGHYSSAYDVALMSRELITKHPQISNYSTVWMDSITHKTKKGESEFGLTNTNKLVRFYDGITGLKTGSTSKAKYCLSATARRNDMDLIAVVMAAPDHKKRFSEAQSLLDYGFANCSVYKDSELTKLLKEVPVQGGRKNTATAEPTSIFSHIFIQDADMNQVKRTITYEESIKAPLQKGSPVGKAEYYYNGKLIGSVQLTASETVEEAGLTDYLLEAVKKLFHKL